MFQKFIKIKDNYYFLALAILLICLSLYIWQRSTSLFYNYSDFDYHLSVAQAFIRAKGIVAWDFWESMPMGRPHNYPPLFHVILALFIKSGFTILTSTKLIIELVLVGGFLLYAYGLTKIFNIKIAFWAVFLLSFCSSFVSMSATVLPATLVLFCSPLLFYLALNRKWIAYSALLLLLLYTHMFMPYYILFALFIYLSFFERKFFWSFFKFSLLAYIFYLPWAINIIVIGLTSIKYFDSKSIVDDNQIGQVGINLIILFLTFVGLSFVCKKLKNKFNFSVLFIILGLEFLPFSAMSANRMLNGHFLASAAPIAAIALSYLLNNKKFFIFTAILLFLYIWQPPYLFAFKSESIKLFFEPSPLKTALTTKFNSNDLIENKYANFYKLIEQNSAPGEPIVSAVSWFNGSTIAPIDQVYVADLFASNSSRPTLNLRQPELFYRNDPNLSFARFVLLNVPSEKLLDPKCQRIKFTTYDLPCSFANDFKLLETYQVGPGNNLYLYRSASDKIVKEKIPRFVFPFWLAILIILGFTVIITKQIKSKIP